MTFSVDRISEMTSAAIRTVRPGVPANASPVPKEAPTAGIHRVRRACREQAERSALATGSPLPWLNTIAPTAPAASALATLVPNGQRAPLQQGDLADDDAAGARVEVGGLAAARRRPAAGSG